MPKRRHSLISRSSSTAPTSKWNTIRCFRPNARSTIVKLLNCVCFECGGLRWEWKLRDGLPEYVVTPHAASSAQDIEVTSKDFTSTLAEEKEQDKPWERLKALSKLSPPQTCPTCNALLPTVQLSRHGLRLDWTIAQKELLTTRCLGRLNMVNSDMLSRVPYLELPDLPYLPIDSVYHILLAIPTSIYEVLGFNPDVSHPANMLFKVDLSRSTGLERKNARAARHRVYPLWQDLGYASRKAELALRRLSRARRTKSLWLVEQAKYQEALAKREEGRKQLTKELRDLCEDEDEFNNWLHVRAVEQELHDFEKEYGSDGSMQ